MRSTALILFVIKTETVLLHSKGNYFEKLSTKNYCKL